MKSMNRKESKKIVVLATVIMGLMMFAFMPLASADVTDFTVTPSSGVVGAVDSYNVLVTTDGVTTIEITIPAGFIAVAPTTGGVLIAEVNFWNSTSKAYYGYATIKSNNTHPKTKVDVVCKLGGETATKTQDVDYTAGETSTFESGFACDTSSATITLPTEDQDGSINITINCSECPGFSDTWRLDDVMIAIKQFVRNPKVPGNYPFDADGIREWVTISEKKGCSAVFRNGLWYADASGDHNTDIFFQYGIPGDKPAVGDVNNDGSNDVVAYRHTGGGWWYVDFDGDQKTDDMFHYGGQPGDIPVVGDYNNDGTVDTIIYRNGQWWVRGVVGPVFMYGIAGDIPLVADYDNDGQNEVIIYRNGQWWVRGVVGPVFMYGVAGDKPIVDDIRDDGYNDVAVLRNGLWYVKEKAGAITDFTFRYGITGDVPVIHELG